MNDPKDPEPSLGTVKAPHLVVVPSIEAHAMDDRPQVVDKHAIKSASDPAMPTPQTPRRPLPKHMTQQCMDTMVSHSRDDGLPAGYIVRSDGIYKLVGTEDEQEEVWLCSQLRVVARYRNAVNTGWGRLVEVMDADGKTHQLSIDDQRIASSSGKVLAALADRGLRYDSAKAVIELLRNWEPSDRMTSVNHLGWSDVDCSSFVLGNGRVIGDADVLPNQASLAATSSEIKELGTKVEWRDNVGVPCIGNPLLITAVSLAFSGPLLAMLGMDNGGGLHFRGSSSCGKSTTVRAATSVWGSPNFVQSWRATSSGLESVAAASNGTVLALDELAEVSAKDCFEAVYMLANGTGKTRADSLGNARPPLKWKVAMISAGEISIAEKLAEGGLEAKAGQEMRLLDIVVEGRRFGAFDDLHGAADGSVFADSLKSATTAAYGTAGPAFVEALLRNCEITIAWAKRAMEFYGRRMVEDHGCAGDGQIQRAVTRFALIAVAGELATQFGLTGWARGDAIKAASEVFGDWLHQRRAPQSMAAEISIARTRAFLEAHASEFVDASAPDYVKVKNPDFGWRYGGIFYFTRETWHEIHPGKEAEIAAELHEGAGMLIRGEGRNLMQKLLGRIHPTRPRVYAVTASVLDDPELAVAASSKAKARDEAA